MSTTNKTKVIVLGSGVIGLTVALVLSEGTNADLFEVHVAARDLPEDVHSQAFASPWAGAIDNWAPDKYNEKYARWEERTREKWLEMKPIGLVLNKIESKIYSRDAPSEELRKRYEYVHSISLDSDLARDFGIQYVSGCKTSTVHPHYYLAALKTELEKRGVGFQRQYFASLDEVCELAGEGGVVVNASALGARSLLGVEDTTVYPIRGQTIRVHAPKAHEFVVCSDRYGPTNDWFTHCVPRPGPHNEVLIGGTSQSGNWDTSVNWDTAESIWDRIRRFVPELNGPDVRIIEHDVALRPAREGGPRVEMQKYTRYVECSHTRGSGAKGAQMTTLVVHAYGFGGSGYQQSWGAAEEAVNLLKEAMPKTKGGTAQKRT